jgi:hypothetical protein
VSLRKVKEASIMTTSDLLQQIRKNLEKRRLEIAEGMVDGRMADFNAYQKNVGIAEGLMQASEIIRETLKTLNEEDV